MYLDNAATAEYKKTDSIVIDEIIYAMQHYWTNPSSLYNSYVKKEIDRCRENIARFIGAKPDEIYFTSGSSESNNWVIRGWSDQMSSTTLKPSNIITTRIEHKSILGAVKNTELSSRIHYCGVENNGLISIKTLEYLLKSCKDQPILVSVHHGNNEIGTIQNIKQIVDLVRSYNGALHVDVTQTFGHIPIDVNDLGVDMISASGHKVSPVLRGIGFLYIRNGINIKPLIYGAQEKGLRGGTENTYGIVGLSKALEYCDISYENVKKLCMKRDYFINALVSKFGCKLNGHDKQRLPNNINVTFPQNITGESLLLTLDMAGIQVSTSSACNSREIKPSHVLKEIGLTDDEAMRTARFSLPENITYEQIDKVISEIDKAIKIIEV